MKRHLDFPATGTEIRKPFLYGGLGLGVTSVSCAAILIRYCDAPSLAVAMFRLLLAALILFPLVFGLARAQVLSVTRREWALISISGVCLGTHFVCWIASLNYTSVSSSVVIVTGNPILVALGARLVLNENVSRRMMLGIFLGLFGGSVIAFGDWGLGGNHLYGDGLAVAGGIALAIYYVISRDVRKTVPSLPYSFSVFALAAVFLLGPVVVTKTPLFGFSNDTYLFLFLLALVPQFAGHSLLNWALGYLGATVVSGAVMAEPVGASVLAWVILDEVPSVTTMIGAGLVLSGLYQVLTGHRGYPTLMTK